MSSSDDFPQPLVYGPDYSNLRRFFRRKNLPVSCVEPSQCQGAFVTYNASENKHLIDGNIIALYPVNDGRSTGPQEYFMKTPEGEVAIISNTNNFKEIPNLDALLLQTTNIMQATLDSNIVIHPFGGFFLYLQKPVYKHYNGSAELLLLNHNSAPYERNGKEIEALTLNDVEYLQARFANIYLDYFIGWNFGFCVRRNSTLRETLEAFAKELITRKKRQRVGQGFELVTHTEWFVDFQRE